ncbi:MAG: MiaB/RimO family radical SAM methylthiotransferase [Gemmatimonadetes bacterium]|nr:MiaB/RimO family radical SAM methylthiotransferase [Gemmatimonadota bacterium]MDA1102837.1 MiaB/RimO family radical SAM methylthiotransferase [Gemmatimonadota bacterium]
MNPSPRLKRAYVETYGCQMNISDGELMEGILADGGYEIVRAPEDADVVLVNTCAIREHAERRVLGRVSQLNGLKLERPDLLIGVTGCMAQRLGETLLEQAPYVDLVMGPDGYRGLPEALARLERGEDVDHAALGAAETEDAAEGVVLIHGRKRGPQLAVLALDMDENYQGLEQRRADGPAAWVPIQRGCDHRCTYCIVPYVRGGEKNRSAVEILSEVRGLAEQGVSEVTLLGQTVNSYVWKDVDFPSLLRDVARIDGIGRVRFTSPHPNDVTERLVEVMAEETGVCEQLHLPAQSGDDRTLRRMLRRYTVESLLEKIELVRTAIPDIALSTDIIVAFPGETDAEFRATLGLMREVRFDEAFTYKYSLREGTPATRLPAEDFIDSDEAQSRLAELIEVTRAIQSEINEAELGRIEEVLIENRGRDEGQIRGRTRRNKVVVFDGDASRIGQYARTMLDRTTGATFVGTEVGAHAAVEG